VSPRARFFGAAALVACFVGLNVLVVGYRGLNPATFTGVEIGSAIGLASLVLEIHVIERAMRSARSDAAGATFQTFAMRLALLAPLMFVFQRRSLGVDSQAFAVSYLVTFFVYLCWLTWKTYHAPVQFKGKAAKFTPRVVEKKPDEKKTLVGVPTGEWL
jgi:hypothetical protein